MNTTFNGRPLKLLLAAGAAAFGLSLAAPASAGGFSNLSVEFGDVDIDLNKEDFLQSLIEMDADDIDDLRADMAEAREEVLEAIEEVREARREAKEDPEAAGFVDIAFAAASGAVETSTRGVFDQVYELLDSAESDLDAGKVEISAAEMRETREAIAVLRDGLDGVEDALAELLAAMKSA